MWGVGSWLDAVMAVDWAIEYAEFRTEPGPRERSGF